MLQPAALSTSADVRSADDVIAFEGCDALVCTPAEQEAILRGSRKGNDLKKKILRESEERAIQAQAAAVKEAKARKDRLLHYQSTSAKRMTVIDDESDYFSHDSNRWMSAEGKAKLKKKEEGEF